LAREASPEERAAFGEKQMILPVARLWSLDAFGVHLAISRAKARAPRGERAVVVEPFETGGNILSSALSRSMARPDDDRANRRQRK